MKDYIPKWHRELEIFDSIMPVIVLEGNVLDKYQYPVDGSIQKGSIVKLTEYLHYFFKDAGYSSIVFMMQSEGFTINVRMDTLTALQGILAFGWIKGL